MLEIGKAYKFTVPEPSNDSVGFGKMDGRRFYLKPNDILLVLEIECWEVKSEFVAECYAIKLLVREQVVKINVKEFWKANFKLLC